LLVPLASDVSGISKHLVLCRTDLLCCCDNLFSEIIRSHYLQSISILLRYLRLVFFIWHLLNFPYQNFARVSHQSHGLYNILTKIVYAFVQWLVRPAAKYRDISLPSNYVTPRIPFFPVPDTASYTGTNKPSLTMVRKALNSRYVILFRIRIW